MPREQFNTRLPGDRAEAVHRFAERRGLGKSEAAARLIERGLASRGIAGKVAYGLAWLAMATFTAAVWLWGVYGGTTAPWAAASTPEVAVAAVLSMAYLALAVVAELVARGYVEAARRRSA